MTHHNDNQDNDNQAAGWYDKKAAQASQYFELLSASVHRQDYAEHLMEDVKAWKQQHLRPLLSRLLQVRKEPRSAENFTYLKYLQYNGRLNDYLSRSITYIYMRDLGASPENPAIQQRIQNLTVKIEHLLEQHVNSNHEAANGNLFSFKDLYRWGQKEQIEPVIIWLIEKLRHVRDHIPEGIHKEHAQRKLIKLIAGVVMHALEELGEDVPAEERSRRLGEAIKLGYSYGLTYPFIDDLLDSDVLSPEDNLQYAQMIRQALVTGIVPEPGDWARQHEQLAAFIYRELKSAFEYIQSIQRDETRSAFFEQTYVFFHAQEIDRIKRLDYAAYSNEELYIPIILKSAASRTIVRSVLAADASADYEERTFYFGIYNQLSDDFADLYEDLEHQSVTPYTYYLTHRENRPDLINPFELYWAVVHYLIHHLYQGNKQVQEAILSRAISSLHRCRSRLGHDKYKFLMKELEPSHTPFAVLLQQLVRDSNPVQFFDKLLRDQLISSLRSQEEEKAQFRQTMENARQVIQASLPVPLPQDDQAFTADIIAAANYSLQGDSKLLRPVIAYVMGVLEYGFAETDLLPLLRSLEYMHTASLIFDDLPSQDNAATRRGRPTLHKVYDSASAELAGVYLIQKAMQEQASLTSFDPSRVQTLMKYSAERAGDMCAGQMKDLSTRGQTLTLEELNALCYYKTGIAFEASLVMPAILAGTPADVIDSIKKFAYHAGIAFQIQDDVLDTEGHAQTLGKDTQMDRQNGNSTFVTILGVEGARQAMWDHYCSAMEAVEKLKLKTAFFQHFLDYIIHRSH
ncbi:polyprenyl synthetase family protein [Paenibacillus sp. JSM ZJ436]|uniref:polyprenyl synthetase family protein n=1 Tax=Paenibacillus sp. JSM ZJ436 TaxID=3376190 RepID=UPI0037A0830D